jgi:predicted dehydrogenase
MDKLRIGVIGAGLWGGNHARVFTTLPETELVAVCDQDSSRAQAMADRAGGARVYTDYRALIADSHVDAVSVATPDFTHTPIILAALAADKHVLSEKPLATTLEEAEQIAAAAARSKAKLMVDFHNRANPVLVALHDEVAAGAIGRPVHGFAKLSNTTFVPLQMLSWAARSSALWFLGSHLVDVLRYVLGDEVKRVYAVARKGVLESRGVATHDVHLSMLEFARGTVVTMENSWILSELNPMVYDFRVDLVGEKGQLTGNPSHNGAITKMTGDALRFGDSIGVTPTGHARVGGFVLEAIARFVDQVLHDAPPLASLEDGLTATRILAAIERSAASGQPVDL